MPLSMIFQALNTWFQTYGVLLKLPMINMYYGVFLIGENNVEVMRKHGYGYLRKVEVRRADNKLYTFKEGDFVSRTTRTYKLYKFSDGTLTRISSSLDDITKNIHIEYMPKRKWSALEKKRSHIMIKDIDKMLKERRMMKSLEKIISLEREFNLRNPQHAFKRCEVCGSLTHTTTDHIEWFKRGEALQAKKAEALKSTRTESSNANRSNNPTKRRQQSKETYHITFDESPDAFKFLKPSVDNINIAKIERYPPDEYLYPYEPSQGVFNTRRKQIEETYHITFNEIADAIKFSKPLVDNINIAKTERYPPDEYLYPYEPSQRYQTNNNDVSFIEPYESPKPVVLETKVSSDQNGQTNENNQNAQTNEILNDNLSKHFNHNNDEQIIVNLPNTKDIQISEHLSSSNDKHIKLVNIIRNPGAEMLTRAMDKELSAASAHECLFIDFLSGEKPKKVSKALKKLRWVDAMQDELN
nr:hypothetical protein [Tanacetum cinerariifolium]